MKSSAHGIAGLLVLMVAAGCNERIHTTGNGFDAGNAGETGFAGFSAGGIGGVGGGGFGGFGGYGGGSVGGTGGFGGVPPDPSNGGAGPVPFLCNSVVCSPLPDTSQSSPFVAATEPCCTAYGACGVTNSTLFNSGTCLERDLVGQPSAECPNEAAGPFSPMSSPLLGCCRPDGRCGLVYTSPFGGEIGAGCTERQELTNAIEGSMLSQLLGRGVNWSFIPCTYVMRGTEDAGVTDDADAGTPPP